MHAIAVQSWSWKMPLRVMRRMRGRFSSIARVQRDAVANADTAMAAAPLRWAHVVCMWRTCTSERQICVVLHQRACHDRYGVGRVCFLGCCLCGERAAAESAVGRCSLPVARETQLPCVLSRCGFVFELSVNQPAKQNLKRPPGPRLRLCEHSWVWLEGCVGVALRYRGSQWASNTAKLWAACFLCAWCASGESVEVSALPAFWQSIHATFKDCRISLQGARGYYIFPREPKYRSHLCTHCVIPIRNCLPCLVNRVKPCTPNLVQGWLGQP